MAPTNANRQRGVQLRQPTGVSDFCRAGRSSRQACFLCPHRPCSRTLLPILQQPFMKNPSIGKPQSVIHDVLLSPVAACAMNRPQQNSSDRARFAQFSPVRYFRNRNEVVCKGQAEAAVLTDAQGETASESSQSRRAATGDTACESSARQGIAPTRKPPGNHRWKPK